jgi:phosphoglycerate dehydrogenase-like enzyme
MIRISLLLTLLVGLIVPAWGQDLPPVLQGLGLKESKIASRDLPGWQKPEKVVIHNLFGADVVTPLKAVAPGVNLVSVTKPQRLLAEVADADVFIGICEPTVLAAAHSVKWMQSYFAGVEDCVDLPLFADGDVVLSNGQRLGSSGLADHSIALMMALVRGLDGFQREQAAANWNRMAVPQLFQFGEVSGRTILVVGLGGIGTQVAQRAHGLGMRVLATRGSRREGPDYIEYIGLAHEAIELAAKADVVVNAAPLTDSTRGMFNAAFFKAMKPGAYFVSVGRGKSTVTDDLVAALKAGEIAGAGLDVTDPEPLPADHELWHIPRVIITPHVAGMSGEAMQRVTALVVENLRRYVAGEPLLSVVDIEKGY